MGSQLSALKGEIFQPGSLAIVQQNAITMYNEMHPDDLYQNETVKIIKSGNILQSRTDAIPITVSKVIRKNGMTEVFLSSNLKKVG